MLTFNANTHEIVIDRGDDQTLRVPIVDSVGVSVDVTAGSFRFTVKEGIDDAIGDAIFQLTNPAASGIDLALAAAGIVDIVFPGTYLQNMAGNYVYDLEMDLAGNVRTLISAARFRVRKDVSTPGSATNPTLPIAPFPAAVSIAGALYQKDQVTGLWFKSYYSNGQYLTDGPNASIPF